MEKSNQEQEKYLSNFKEKKFTSKNFIELLLPLLCQRKVYKFTESDLREKLYYYYSDPEFKELFQGICKNKYGNSVDISDAIY